MGAGREGGRTPGGGRRPENCSSEAWGWPCDQCPHQYHPYDLKLEMIGGGVRESILGWAGPQFCLLFQRLQGQASSGDSDQGPEVAAVQTGLICRNNSLHVRAGLVKCHEKDVTRGHRAMLFKHI